MPYRNEFRLGLLAFAILAGLALQHVERHEVAECDPCHQSTVAKDA